MSVNNDANYNRVFPESEVYEIADNAKLKNPIVFAGFVGAGLVGPLSVGYLIGKLGMKEIGFLRSRHLPPATVFIQGRLRHPFRFYSNAEGTMAAVICEITLKKEGIYPIASSILNWAEKHGSNEIVVLDGVPSNNGHDKKTFCAAEEDLCRIMEEKGITMVPQGFITGIPGGILNETILRKIRGLTMLVRANQQHPDPIAAATLVEAVNKMYGTKIDTAELETHKDKIGQDFKELSEKYKESKRVESSLYM